MQNSSSPASLASRIEQLVQERDRLASRMAEIDATLSQVGGLLGSAPAGRRGRRPGVAVPGRKRRRGTYAMTAEESILAFVKKHGNPSTREIKKLWNSEGRRGTADNVLSRMVKDRKLKRTAIPGERGSTYTLP